MRGAPGTGAGQRAAVLRFVLFGACPAAIRHLLADLVFGVVVCLQAIRKALQVYKDKKLCDVPSALDDL